MLTSEAIRCEICRTPLQLSAGAPGCLNCLLNAGSSERQFQHYEVLLSEEGATLAELGRGAMGITYRALDLNLGSPVALKVISARYSNQPEARERFRQEARAAARLRHPNVASVFHYGETPEGHCFYAMELVEGETLEAKVQREGSLGAEVALEIGIQVARALVAAEKHGLIHRDLKPSNLMLVPNEQENSAAPLVKVIDFGLAKIIGSKNAPDQIAQSGFSGTLGFASPEQSRANLGILDTRSDIYSLGATLRYALTGQSVPEKEPGGQLDDLRLARIPEPLIALLRSMLAFEATKRPQSAAALALAMDNCRRRLSLVRQRRRWLSVAVVLPCLLVGGFILTKHLRRRAPSEIGAGNAPPRERIAVLPFADLSKAEADPFLIAGIQDDLLTSLAQIQELKVIGRTSVAAFQPGARDLREIGRSLGVARAVEGSVRHAGDRVVVNVRLVDTRSGREVWADHFDDTLADSIGLQGQLADEIATALQAKLAPAERARLEAKPTTNSKAYALYLKGRGHEAIFDKTTTDLAAAAQCYRQAIALDLTFALAYARLSITDSVLATMGDSSLQIRARAEAEEALRLAPALGEGHMARGFCLDWVDHNYPEALKELSIAGASLPDDSDLSYHIAGLYSTQGNWPEAIATMRRSEERDPRNPEAFFRLGDFYMFVRDWARAIHSYERGLSVAPTAAEGKISLAYITLFRDDNTEAGEKILASLLPRSIRME